MKQLFLKLIRFYQRRVSPLFPPKCRYYPTCSNYMLEAVERYGLARGLFLGLKRLSRCNIFFPGGVDPVPDLKVKMKNERRKNENGRGE